jgi:hypothetical protein
MTPQTDSPLMLTLLTGVGPVWAVNELMQKGPLWVICCCSELYHTDFRCGSISEVITLNTPCSGDERKAEPICCLISGVFSSQFGQMRRFDE